MRPLTASLLPQGAGLLRASPQGNGRDQGVYRGVSVHPILSSLLSWLLLLAITPAAPASEYAAQIRHAELSRVDDTVQIKSHIDYSLSPTAQEALSKGVALEWLVLVEVRQSEWPWDDVVFSLERPYRLQFHALLNQYAVHDLEHTEMFLTLHSALSFMSQLQIIVQNDLPQLHPERDHRLAIKAQFQREALPVPLRPFSYLDPQWYLSSNWFLWPIPK